MKLHYDGHGLNDETGRRILTFSIPFEERETREQYASLLTSAVELLSAARAFNDAFSFISEDCPAPLIHAVRKTRRAIKLATRKEPL